MLSQARAMARPAEGEERWDKKRDKRERSRQEGVVMLVMIIWNRHKKTDLVVILYKMMMMTWRKGSKFWTGRTSAINKGKTTATKTRREWVGRASKVNEGQQDRVKKKPRPAAPAPIMQTPSSSSAPDVWQHAIMVCSFLLKRRFLWIKLTIPF